MKTLNNVTVTVNNKTVRIQNNLDDTQKERQIMMVFCSKPVTCKATAENNLYITTEYERTGLIKLVLFFLFSR